MGKNLVQVAAGLSRTRSQDDPELRRVMAQLAFLRLSRAISRDIAVLGDDDREHLAAQLLMGPLENPVPPATDASE